MWWKKDRKTDLFASVAMFAAAGGGAGPTGGADVGAPGPGPSGPSGRGDGGDRDDRRDISPSFEAGMVAPSPTLTDSARQRGIQQAQAIFDDQVQSAIEEARASFEQGAQQRGLSMQDRAFVGGPTIDELFSQENVTSAINRPDDFSQFVSAPQDADVPQKVWTERDRPAGEITLPSVTQAYGERFGVNNLSPDDILWGQSGPPSVNSAVDQFNLDRSGIEQAAQSDFDPGQATRNTFSQAQERARNELGQQLNEFASPGFAQNVIGQDFGQSDVDAILNEQFNQARGVLENAGARGQITDQGFSSGIEAIGGQRETAQAELSDAAQGIRGNLRQSLRDRASRARENAANFELGGNFNPQDVGQQLQSIEQRGAENFRGNLRGDVSIDELFSPEEAITTAGQAQGQANQGRLSLIGALQNRNRRPGQNNRERGLGTQGSF
jgi:hypothetical protein